MIDKKTNLENSEPVDDEHHITDNNEGDEMMTHDEGP
jgi:hypothetical protein